LTGFLPVLPKYRAGPDTFEDILFLSILPQVVKPTRLLQSPLTNILFWSEFLNTQIGDPLASNNLVL